MRPELLLTILLCLSTAAQAQTTTASAQTSASATLPLDEILRLHQQLKQAQKPPAPEAPITATLDLLELSGRLLQDAVDLRAQFQVTVLAQDTWVDLALLAKDSATHLSALPAVEGGYFAVRDGWLRFLARQAGSYRFELKLYKKAQAKGRERRLELGFANASSAALFLQLDQELFELQNTRSSTRDSRGMVIMPKDQRFVLQWTQRPDAIGKQTPTAARRPPIESMIESAHASVVATLEGRHLIRVLYRLHFEGQQTISFALPPGQELRKVFLHNTAIPHTIKDNRLELTVTPTRAGDVSATLELDLLEHPGRFSLSGTRKLSFPRASWRINDFYAAVHLPPVFNYVWQSGSLTPVASTPPINFANQIPTPGKDLNLHQQLVGTAPQVQLRYQVDLTENYFTGR